MSELYPYDDCLNISFEKEKDDDVFPNECVPNISILSDSLLHFGPKALHTNMVNDIIKENAMMSIEIELFHHYVEAILFVGEDICYKEIVELVQ